MLRGLSGVAESMEVRVMRQVQSAKGESKWMNFSWVPVLTEGSPAELRAALKGTERALAELWDRHVYDPQNEDQTGLFFPIDLKSLERVQRAPWKVFAGYAVVDGQIAGGVMVHLKDAIGEYAHGSINWAKRELGATEVAFVRSLCVDLRGFGIGRSMLIEVRKLARHLGCNAVVGHLRVAPTRAVREEKAYVDSGFTQCAREVTAMVWGNPERGWQEILAGRELPADPQAVADATRIQLRYVPMVAPAAKHIVVDGKIRAVTKAEAAV